MRLSAAARAVSRCSWMVACTFAGSTGASTYVREKDDGGFVRLADDRVRDAPFALIAPPSRNVQSAIGCMDSAARTEGCPRATGATKCRRTTIYRERVK